MPDVASLAFLSDCRTSAAVGDDGTVTQPTARAPVTHWEMQYGQTSSSPVA